MTEKGEKGMKGLEGLTLVHYCHKNCEPLHTIMSLPREEAFALAGALARENPEETAFGRFADFENYYPRRLEVERRLYQRFLRLGGRPEQEHPLSFVLEGSEMLDRWFGRGLAVRAPLSAIPAQLVSFTYGDSMTVTERQGDFTMLTKAMLAKAIEESGGAGRFVEEVNGRFNYMEVQFWGDRAALGKIALDKGQGA